MATLSQEKGKKRFELNSNDSPSKRQKGEDSAADQLEAESRSWLFNSNESFQLATEASIEKITEETDRILKQIPKDKWNAKIDLVYKTSMRFTKPSKSPRYFLIGPPGTGKTFATEKILRSCSGFNELSLFQTDGATTPFMFEYRLDSVLNPTLVIKPMSRDALKNLLDCYARGSDLVTLEEARSLNNRLQTFIEMKGMGEREQEECLEDQPLMEEFAQWMLKFQDEEQDYTIHCPSMESNPAEWLSERLVAISLMLENFPWPRSVWVKIPILPGLRHFTLVDLPGLRDAKEDSDGKDSEAVINLDLALVGQGDILLLCQNFKEPNADEALLSFLNTVSKTHPSIVKRSALLLLRTGDAKILGDKGKRVLSRAEALEKRPQDIRDNFLKKGYWLPTVCFPQTNVEKEMKALLIQLQYFQHHLRLHHLHTGEKLYRLNDTEGYKRWCLDVLSGTKDSWSKERVDTKKWAENVASKFDSLGQIKYQTIRGAINRKGSFKGVQLSVLIEQGASEVIRERLSDLEKRLTSANLEDRSYVDKTIVCLKDSVELSLRDLGENESFWGKMKSDEDLWEMLGKRKGDGYRVNVLSDMKDWIKKHDAELQEEVIARLNLIIKANWKDWNQSDSE